MSKTRIVTVVCSIISVLALVGLLLWFLFGTTFGLARDGFSFSFNFGDVRSGAFEVQNVHQIPTGDIDAVSINWTSGNIIIEPHDGDQIQITEFATRALRSGEQARVGTGGGTLTVAFQEDRNIRRMPSKNLEVLVPRALYLDGLSINSTSGRVSVYDIDIYDLRIDSTSGRMDITGVTAGTVNIDSTAGRVYMASTSADRIDLRSTSGRVEFSRVTAQDMNIDTTSGRQDFNGSFYGNINLRSITGRIAFTSNVVPNDLAAHATSGRLEITVPSGDPISVQQSTTAGRFSSEIPVITQSGADAQFRLSTTSGRISIYALR